MIITIIISVLLGWLTGWLALGKRVVNLSLVAAIPCLPDAAGINELATTKQLSRRLMATSSPPPPPLTATGNNVRANPRLVGGDPLVVRLLSAAAPTHR